MGGVDRTSKAAAFLRRIEAMDARVLLNSAITGEGHAKDSLDHPGPQAPSNPGEAPNSQTGALWEGIEAEVIEDQHVAWVQSTRNGDADVPHHLEFGTENMQERPYMRPSYDKTRAEAGRIIRESWEETDGSR